MGELKEFQSQPDRWWGAQA